MGGYGSGRRHGACAKQTVENCLVLASAKLQRDRMLLAGIDGAGSLTWTHTRTGEETASVGYEVNTLDRANAWIHLHYTLRGGEDYVDHRVQVTTTPLPWGGVRWWFICPSTVSGRGCGRRCGKLYLPPGERYFGCRLCYDLTYTSAQEAHKYDGMYRLLARQMGTSPAIVKYRLKNSGRRRRGRSGAND